MAGPFSLAMHHHFASGAAGSTATWNPSDKAANVALSGGNYIATMTDTNLGMVRATISKAAGKWYFEGKYGNSNNVLGITTPGATLAAGYPGLATNSWGYVGAGGGVIYNSGGGVATPGGAVTNDVIMVAVDFTNLKIWFGLNGSWFSGGNPATNTGGNTLVAGTYFPAGDPYNTTSAPLTINFGAIAFAYTPPAGFLAWG